MVACRAKTLADQNFAMAESRSKSQHESSHRPGSLSEQRDEGLWPGEAWLFAPSDEEIPELSLADLFRASASPLPSLAIPGVSLGTLQEGDEFAGYRLLVRLGKGAFGKVYLAEECNLARRLVVVKISERHLEEPHALARLQHSHIVPIYSLHDDPLSGLQAIVMPYLGGVTLDTVLRTIGDPTKGSIRGRDLLEIVDAHTLATLRRLYDTESTSREFVPGGASDSTAVSSRSLNRSVGLPAESEHISLRASVASDGMSEDYRETAWGRFRTWWLGKTPAVTRSTRELLEALSYEQAIQWIGAKLAQALDHAHSRGVLHRDIKPANVLLAQDGRPLLLDFNLAEIVTTGKKKAIGGTLAYMAPEHLRAFKEHGRGSVSVDQRSDIYSLGVVLYELLTGELPFERARNDVDDQELDRLIQSRYVRPPRIRTLNPRVSPALEAIVHRCIEPDPELRYASAAEVAEDLQRDLDCYPMRFTREPSLRYRARKWIIRHPRLTLSLVAACLTITIASVAGLAVAAAGKRVATVESELAREELARKFELARSLAYAAIGSGNQELHRYAVDMCNEALSVPGEPPAPRSGEENERIADLYFLRAMLQRSLAHATPDLDARRALYARALEDINRGLRLAGREPRHALSLKGQLLLLLGRGDEGETALRRARSTPLQTAEDFYMEGSRLLGEEKSGDAVRHFREALRRDPRHFWALFGLAQAYAQQNKIDEAFACYVACLAIWPDNALIYLNRGSLFARLGRYDEAISDLSRAVELRPELGPAYAARGWTYLRLGKHRQAASDFSYAIARGLNDPRTRVAYGTCLARIGDYTGAQRQFEAAYSLSSTPEEVAVAAAAALAEIAPRSAMEWLDRVLRVNPDHARAWYVRGCLLAEHLNRPRLALDAVRRCLEIDPLNPSALALEALLLIRTGNSQEGLKRAELAETLQLEGSDWYVVASCYALLGKEDPTFLPRCVAALRRAKQCGQDMSRLQKDPDFAWLRTDPHYGPLLHELARGN